MKHLLLAALFATSIARADYDQRQHIPAGAAKVGDAVLVLQRLQANCPKDSQRALLVFNNLTAWVGCWRVDRGTVYVLFEDGERLHAGEGAFNWFAAPGSV